jgi:hypothetical protein
LIVDFFKELQPKFENYENQWPVLFDEFGTSPLYVVLIVK